MLSVLHIRQVVLIDRLDINFQAGFCALTGETGAGKSILLDSLGLALGARAEAGLVRKGAEQASVVAHFEVDNDHLVWDMLREQGIEAHGELILKRVLNADGRSKAFINDQPVSVAFLRNIGDVLIEIHGQFDTQGLLNPDTHRNLLDQYAGVNTQLILKLWDTWHEAQHEYDVAMADQEAARREENYLRQSYEDLNELAPQDGEEEALVSLRDRLQRRTQILQNLQTGEHSVQEAETILNTAYRALERVGDGAADAISAIDRAISELRDASAFMQATVDELEEGDHNLEAIDDRLHALRAQARKHQVNVDSLPAILDDLARRLSLIDGQSASLEALGKKIEDARKSFIKEAQRISKIRHAKATELDQLVAGELPPLKLDKARFETHIENLEEQDWSPYGLDRVRFMVATNPGAPAGPIHKIASGGEMSRFMLALKVVMAAVGSAGTLVFDEVDSGIGGATAAAVGDRLERLSKQRQILVVTHSPQVAAKSDHHFIVQKSGTDKVTTNIIGLVSNDDRKEEIARMISGTSVSDEARAAAHKLMQTGS
jgi:DNA repair protein RecN (Recombination protein N)